ncbi:endonuclease/exonuclease/phosphatase family protein [Nocardia sp. NBC_00403]|uniref:endonuclease/exonuclease/phosphatase family protein n=1 Tax=Nocardia sp. NBC_00403 TaxID=2975990 RepID=UPI002E1C8F45
MPRTVEDGVRLYGGAAVYISWRRGCTLFGVEAAQLAKQICDRVDAKLHSFACFDSDGLRHVGRHADRTASRLSAEDRANAVSVTDQGGSFATNRGVSLAKSPERESQYWEAIGFPPRRTAAERADPYRPLRVVTFNIAGAYPIKSKGLFGYNDKPNLDYFSMLFDRLDADVILIQEGEVGPAGSTVRKLAQRTGYEHVFESKVCPTHLSKTPDTELSLAVLSRLPIDGGEAIQLPTPMAKLVFRGEPTVPYPRWAQRADILGINFWQLFPNPHGAMRSSYEHGVGAQDAASIARTMTSNIKSPAILGADFNTENPTKVYGKAFDEIGVKMSLPPDTKTVFWDANPDQIGATKQFETVASGAGRSTTDHFPAWVDYEIKDPAMRERVAAARRAQ